MTEADQITLYSCHLCGFCETSLAALTKHTSSHIKSEQSNDQPRQATTGSFDLIQRRDGEIMKNPSDVTSSEENDANVPRVMVESNGTSIVVVSSGPRDARMVNRERANASDRFTKPPRREMNGEYVNLSQSEENEDDDEIIVVHEREKSPRVADVFPNSSGSSNPQSRVFFPSGWNEPATTRTGVNRLPNDQFHNMHQTSSVPAQENRYRSMPKIINCTTVGHRSQPRGYIISNGLETNVQHQEQTGYVASAYELGQVDAELVNEIPVRPVQQRRPMRAGSFVVSSTSPVIQEVFSPPTGTRSHEVHVRAHTDRLAEQPYPRSSPSSAFVPFAPHNNQQSRRHYPSYQEMRTVRTISNQQTSQSYVIHQPLTDHASRSQFSCPVPIPNHGTVVMNPNQPVMLPPFGNHDNVSGILVIPLKKTCDTSVQTDESCLSQEYIQYRPPQSQLDDAHVSTQSEPDAGRVKCSVCQQEFENTQKLRQHIDASHPKDGLRCKDCGQVFLTARNLQMHKVRAHNKRMPFRCGVCGVRFEDRASVVQHLSTHNANEYIFRCDTCGKRFGNEEKLRKHEQKHQDMWHKCIDCNKTFGSEVTLAYHIEQLHKRNQILHENETPVARRDGTLLPGEDAEMDTEAEFAHSREREVISEESVVNSGDDISCELCNSQFSSTGELEKHAKTCGLGEGMKRMFRCAVCQTFFAEQSQLVAHYNSMHHSRDGYMCSKCPRKFRLWSRLKQHIKAFHQVKKPSTLKNVCNVCSERFLSRNKLEEHLRQVHKVQPFQSKVGRIYTCKECKKRFTNLSSLMVHRRGVHSLNILESPSTQTWKCQYCSIERLTKKTYIAHLKEVHDLSVVEKGRSLEIVGKDPEGASEQQLFPSGASREYSEITTGENKVTEENISGEKSCSHCGATFSDAKRLKNHLGLVHEQKPFSCGTCGKKFAYSGQLAFHMRGHGSNEINSDQAEKIADAVISSEVGGTASVEKGPPPHTCIHCNTTYQNEKRLNNHLGMRHGYKNFECDVCNQKFSYSTHLIWHRRSHFPEKRRDGAGKASAEEDLDADQAIDESDMLGEQNEDLESSFDDSKDEEASLKITGESGGDFLINRPVSRFVCGHCGADFTVEEEFRDHMIKVHNVDGERVGDQIVTDVSESQEAGSYFCEICNKQLSTLVGWKVHRTRVHKLTDEKHVFKSPTNASPLSNSVSKDRPTDTAAGIAKEQQAPQPKKNELGSEDLSQSAVYSCSKCSRVFTGLRSLRTHQFKLHAIRVRDVHHRNPLPSSDGSLFSRIQDGEIFQCGTCDYQFSSEKGRRIHCKKMRHAERRGPFIQPDLSNASKDVIVEPVEAGSPRESKRRRVSGEVTSIGSNESSLCELCGAEFPNLNDLRHHFQEMHPEEFSFPESVFKPDDVSDPESNADVSQPIPAPIMIECPRCDRSFPSRKAINAHMVKFHKIKGAALVRSLKEGRSDSLSASNQAATEKQELSSSDISDYSSPRPSGFTICPICQRAYQNRRGLTMHLVRYHHMNKIGIRKVMLGIQFDEDLPSGGQVAKNPSMKARYFTGSNEHCPLCPMVFPSRRSLGTHIFKRHGIRCKQLSPAERRSLFSGSMYPKSNGEPTTVNRENLIATDCPICGGKFVGKRGLRAHVSRIHGLDKVELGFMFPDKNATDDEVVANCNECDRVFNNQRIFATHLYFVHKRETIGTSDGGKNSQGKSEEQMELGSEAGESGSAAMAASEAKGQEGDLPEKEAEGTSEKSSAETEESVFESDIAKYICSDSNCNKGFKTPLELLVHVREKNGRSIGDVEKELKNAVSKAVVEEQDEDYDFIDDDELDGDEDILDDEQFADADLEDDALLEDEELVEDSPAELVDGEKFRCSVCKTEHDDEKSFVEHYEQSHGKMSEEDANRLRKMAERSILLSNAISKDYSLRATASRKAFRSEMEITEQILGVVRGQSAVEEASAVNRHSDSSKSQSVHGQSAISAGKLDAREKSQNQARSTKESPPLSTSDSTNDDEPTKKSAFAAALNLQVMS